jgi:hypothetical protein
LAELRAAWEAARAGRRTVVLIEGETGIGKTRLIEEFIRTIALEDISAVMLRPLVPDSSVPNEGLLRQLVASLASAPGFAATAPDAIAELAEVIAALRDRHPDLPAVGGRQLTDGKALADAFEAVASEHPVLAVFDDLDAASPIERATVAATVTRMTGSILLLLAVTGDADDATRELTVLRSVQGVRRVKLQPLSNRGTRVLDARPLRRRPSGIVGSPSSRNWWKPTLCGRAGWCAGGRRSARSRAGRSLAVPYRP